MSVFEEAMRHNATLPDSPQLIGIVPWRPGKWHKHPVRCIRGSTDDWIEVSPGHLKKEIYMVDAEDWQYLNEKYGSQAVQDLHTKDQIQRWSVELTELRAKQLTGSQL